MRRRRVLYVTGTRAEFGLMERTLLAIRKHPRLELQLAVTGMHLSTAHGHTIDDIRRRGWEIDAIVPWKGVPAHATGAAISIFAGVYAKRLPDVVLVTGDRVETFAAAAAARIGNVALAHVHGGDRAQGQLDDSLRHAISKLAHIHFAATRASAARLFKSGEDLFRIHTVGTPGLDGINEIDAAHSPLSVDAPFALIALHPDSADENEQSRRTKLLVRAARAAGVRSAVVIDSNNDAGWRGIARAWDGALPRQWTRHANLSRDAFLQHLGAAGVLIGNSSSGIIEAASFGTRVVNIGDRQRGRERSANVIDVAWDLHAIKNTISKIWNCGRPRRFAGRNVYGGGGTAAQIASILADVELDDHLKNKLIRY